MSNSKICMYCGERYFKKPEESKRYFGEKKYCNTACFAETLKKPKKEKVHKITEGYSTRAYTHPLYTAWKNMRRRCQYKNGISYKDYGERGIKVCDEWDSGFEPFLRWALSCGWTQGLTLERIDVNGNYYPKNCCWIPRGDQEKNKRSNVYVTYKGETKIAKDWARHCGISYPAFLKRLKKWGDVERVIEEPLHTSQVRF